VDRVDELLVVALVLVGVALGEVGDRLVERVTAACAPSSPTTTSSPKIHHPRRASSRHLRHGIYVTAWFDTELWNDSADDRRRLARSRDRGTTATELASQAENLRDLGLDIRSVVVYVPRPAPSTRRDP